MALGSYGGWGKQRKQRNRGKRRSSSPPGNRLVNAVLTNTAGGRNLKKTVSVVKKVSKTVAKATAPQDRTQTAINLFKAAKDRRNRAKSPKASNPVRAKNPKLPKAAAMAAQVLHTVSGRQKPITVRERRIAEAVAKAAGARALAARLRQQREAKAARDRVIKESRSGVVRNVKTRPSAAVARAFERERRQALKAQRKAQKAAAPHQPSYAPQPLANQRSQVMTTPKHQSAMTAMIPRQQAAPKSRAAVPSIRTAPPTQGKPAAASAPGPASMPTPKQTGAYVEEVPYVEEAPTVTAVKTLLSSDSPSLPGESAAVKEAVDAAVEGSALVPAFTGAPVSFWAGLTNLQKALVVTVPLAAMASYSRSK